MPADAVSVSEAVGKIYKWNCKEVTVVGWLGTCGGLDCGIFQTLEDARLVERGDSNSSKWSELVNRSLSIGYAENFDDEAQPLQFKYVIIRGRLSDECRREITCFDRAAEFVPSSIHPAIPPQKAIECATFP